MLSLPSPLIFTPPKGRFFHADCGGPVHYNTSHLQPVSDIKGGGDIIREHCSLKPVRAVVGQGHGLDERKSDKHAKF